MQFFELLIAESLKSFRIWKRYPFQMFIGLAIMAGLFFGLLFGIDIFSDNSYQEDNLTLITLTYFIWVVVMGALGHSASDIEEDIKIGVLEPIFLSKFGGANVIQARAIVSSFSGVIFSLIFLLLINKASSANIDISISFIVSLVSLDIALVGFGFVLCGMALYLKKIESFTPILLFAVASVLASAMSQTIYMSISEYYYIPLISSLIQLRQAAFGNEIGLFQILTMLIGSIFIYYLGYLMMKHFIAKSKSAASLSHY